MNLEILYRDEHIIAINKPHGLLVHKSFIASDVQVFAVQLLRNQIGQHVTPVHRLDRKTSGVLVFALNSETNRNLNIQFDEGTVQKSYLTIVRGYTSDEEIIDYPLKKENGQMQEAITAYRTIERTEVPVSFGKHTTQRYSLVHVEPKTGRMHQIRRHFAHIFHPIIGDRPHGCNKQNKLFKEKWEMTTMMLHAKRIQFTHPTTKQQLIIEAPLQDEFKRTLDFLGFEKAFIQ